MKTQMQLILAAIPLTALIWIYADQTSHERKTILVAVHVTSPSPNIVPEIEGHLPNESGVRDVEIEVSGPKLALTKLESTKGLRGTHLDVAIAVPENLEPGETYTLNIWSEVAQQVRDRNLALQLCEVYPSEISCRIDRYEEIEVEVELELGSFAGELEVPIVTPSTVTARLLQSDRQTLPATNAPVRVFIEDELQEARLRESTEEFQFTVPLGSKWQRVSTQFKPNHVTITAKFKQLYNKEKITLIPLLVTHPPDWPSDQYSIELEEDERLQLIEVEIPIGITRIPTNADVNAYVIVDNSILPASNGDTDAEYVPVSRTCEVYFHFPDEEFRDVRIITPPPSSPQTVKLRVIKKTNGGKSAP